jgi:hypothetical protein
MPALTIADVLLGPSIPELSREPGSTFATGFQYPADIQFVASGMLVHPADEAFEPVCHVTCICK